MLEDQMEENLFSNNCKQIAREQFEMQLMIKISKKIQRFEVI